MEGYGQIERELRLRFAGVSDFDARTFVLDGHRYAVFYIKNFSSREMINKYVIEPIQFYGGTRDVFDIISNVSAEKIYSAGEAEAELVSGSAVIIADNEDGAVSVSLKNEEGRSSSEPETENVIRGAHEGFTENGGFNAALIRRRIRTSHLKKEDFSIGTQSKTEVSIMYLDNVVRPDVLDTLRRRLSKIRINGVLDSGYVEMFIQDGRFSVYPTVGNSERPDKVAAKILEGRVAVIVDGSPVVLTVPYLFCEGFQVTEDYSKSTFFATFERILRFFGTMLSLFLPAFFIVECKYPDFAPSGFSEYIDKARENIKIPVLMEVLLVFLVFELVREVGLRMPKAVGSAVGIVGSLVLGDSAVEAGIISAPVLIVVAFAAVGNFLCPPYMNANVIYRAVLIFAAGFFGIFGFFAAVCVSVALFCSKNSFGTPYLYPLAPFSLYGQLDYVLMMPLSKQKIIPTALSGKKIRRVGGGENEK